MSITNAALSGLRAASTDLQVTGNNVANAGTFGFKQSRTEFSDLFVSGVGGAQVGNGVQVSGISQEFSQVGFSVTGSAYDIAINGDGFFVLNSVNNGAPLYTRAGGFTVDRDGFITNQGGDRLQGYQAIDNSISATQGDLKIPSGSMAPKATDEIDFNVNLDASEENISASFDKNDPTTYTNRTSVVSYDSLGGEHFVNTYYAKTSANNWAVHEEADGAMLGSGTLTFNDDGSYNASSGLTGVAWSPTNGAAPQTLDFDFSKSTQYGSDMMVRSIVPDGYATGNPSGVDIDQDGIVSVLYSNGTIQASGQIALAKFDNPQGLFSTGKTSWTATNDSGQAVVSVSNSVGALRAGSLEDSNVDLTEQLVRLITAQRSFQANAQSIRAGDTITQTIINIE